MITVIGGGFAGLSAAYFLHRAGKDVTLLEWSRGLGGRGSTRNVGYRTVDAGAQRLDLAPLSSNPLETEARALLKAVADERGVTPHLMQFPGPVLRFDGRSIVTSEHVDVPNWTYLDGGMKVFAEALAKGITVRTHTRISDILVEDGQHKLRNQRGETLDTEAIVVALPAPYALALLQPHADNNKKIRKVCDMLNEVHYEPMVGAIFGTTKINFKEHFSALFTDDVTAPVFWLSQEAERRKLGVRRNENSFVLQLGAEISREYVLKTDKETFAAIERVFEEVLDVPLPDVVYGEIQRWPTAFLVSSPFGPKDAEVKAFDVPLYLAGDYVTGQSSIASAFWSGKSIADKLLGVDASKFIGEPAREQAQLGEEEWGAIVPPMRKPRKPRPAPKKQRAGMEGKGPMRGGRDDRRQGARPGGYQGGGRPGGRPGGGFQRGPRPDGGRGPQQRPWGARPQGPGGPRRPQGDYQGRGEGGGYQQRGPRPQGGPGGGGFNRGPRPQGGGGGYQQRGPGGGGGFNRGPREGGFGGGYEQRSGGYQSGGQQGGGQQGGGYNRGSREGGYQGGGGGGYQRREGGPGGGGYNRAPREGGYQGGGGGGYQRREGGPGGGGQQGGGFNRGPREGGYQGGGGGGYQRREGGGGQQGGGHQGGGGGYNRGPREGGYQGGGGGGYQGGGGGGYQRREGGGGGGGWQDRGNRPQRPQRDYNQQQPPDSAGGPGRKPVKGQVVYSTSNRPAPGGQGGGQPPRYDDRPRPRKPRDEDDNIGNR
jgi:predicted NAD/FAD-dependent oxidoreductase